MGPSRRSNPSEYIDAHGLAEDYFSDPEEEEVQAAQHQLLLKIINQEGLDQDLRRRSQRNPLVLTFDGTVIDGNRRSAALREEGKPENAKAVFLPKDATTADLFETELELQMARETKAPYNWVDQALHVRAGVKDLSLVMKLREKEAISAVANRMNREDKEVVALLTRLGMVDLYLVWLGHSEKYYLIPEDSRGSMQQAFTDIGDRLGVPSVTRLPAREQALMREAAFYALKAGGYDDVRNVLDAIRNNPRITLTG